MCHFVADSRLNHRLGFGRLLLLLSRDAPVMSDTILILMVQGTFHLHGNYQRTFHGIHV
jgi:hypothetical protein